MSDDTSSNQVLIQLIEDVDEPNSPLQWWYRIAALQGERKEDTLENRERLRRSQLTSTIIMVMGIIMVLVFFMGIAIHLLMISFIMIAELFLLGIGIALNRHGHQTLAGALLLLQVNGGQILGFTHLAGGIDLAHFMLLDQAFLLGIVAAISFFSTRGIFVCALLNCIVLALVLRFAPHGPDVAKIINTPDIVPYYLIPIALQALVATFASLWIRSAAKALERADRAHVIAALEHQIAHQMQTMGAEKQLLEQSIQLILATHVQVANGNLGARVPLSRENVLWPLAGSLNTLLSRYQQNYFYAQKYQQLEKEIGDFLNVIRDAKWLALPIQAQPHGTLLDALYVECNNYLLIRPGIPEKALFGKK